MKKTIVFAGVVAILGLSSCKKEQKEDMETHGIHVEHMDKTVSPKEDFFKFVNGNWLANNTIPEDRGTWGSFDELRKRNDGVTLEVLKDAMESGKYKEGTDQYKAMLFFNTAMDTEAINKQGKAPLKPYFEMIDKIQNIADLQSFLTEITPYGMEQLFGYSVGAGLSNSSINTAYLGPVRLGLPDRSYYVDKDADTQSKRDAYVKYLSGMLEIMNIKDAEAKANRIMELETRLATAMLSKEESRDATKLNNPMTVAKLKKLTPAIDWKKYFADLKTGDFETIIVTQPAYMKEVQKVLKTVPISTIKELLTWRVLNSGASMLDAELEQAQFDFYTKTLKGVSQMRPREERMLATTNGVLGEAVGKLYVDKVFPPEAKAKAKEMVENIIGAYHERIQRLQWMSEETKAKARKKLDKLMVQIGYPDTWKDYSTLEVKDFANGGSFFQNVMNARKWNFEEDNAKLNKPVDREEWGMAPQTVNAYFHPLFNKIVFPAAILQPPFYDYKADAAVNYGGIGAVIGHEISHGFDDSGARFDDEGNLNNWWTESDKKEFKELGDRLVAQFDAVKPFEDVHLNGRFTLGENIGDLGGVNSAFEGLKRYFESNGHPEDIDGYTAEQRFFISWATVWRTMMREDEMRNKIKTDPHSPGMYRATMPIQNMDEFHEAFGIKEGDAMYLKSEDRVKIW